MLGVKAVRELVKSEFLEIKNLFNENKKNLQIENDFEEIIAKTHFFSFFSENKLTGCAYFFCDDELERVVRDNFEIRKGAGGKLLFMNGFSKRKCHFENLVSIKKASEFYLDNIFSFTNKKTASYCLMSAGFVPVMKKSKSVLGKNDKLFVLVKN